MLIANDLILETWLVLRLLDSWLKAFGFLVKASCQMMLWFLLKYSSYFLFYPIFGFVI
jgi:hypothetical protein